MHSSNNPVWFADESDNVRKARTIPLRTPPEARRPKWDADKSPWQKPTHKQPRPISKPYKA